MKPFTLDPSPGVEATIDPAPEKVDPGEVEAVRALSSDPQYQKPADLNSLVKQFREQEYRAGRKGIFSSIPSLPTYLEHEEVIVPEIPLHEFHMPVGRKCYAPIARSRCCGGAGHMFRHRRCGCYSRDHFH